MAHKAGGRALPAARPGPLACPSASPDAEDAQLFGIVAGTAEAPATLFIGPRPPDPALLALAAPATPAEVFRFTARCREGACGYFTDGRCGVAAAVVTHLPEAEEASLPRCGIRTVCRWWHEHGAAACRRCPTVVTDDRARDGAYAEALSLGNSPRA
jgi:hypothetical protein